MEETLWDEIINPSEDPSHHLARTRPSTVIFQDFLGPPFHNGMQRINAFPSASVTVSPATTFTALSLTSTLGHLGNVSNPAFSESPFRNPGSPIVFPCFGSNQRAPDYEETTSGGGDRRHKRMVKNRESAARSRARKQAYTNELEIEVEHLVEENARLRKQQEQYRMSLAAQPRKKNKLQRSSTAPF